MLDPLMQQFPQALQSLVHGGWVAVGTFFTLSGFVLARSYARTSWTPSSLLRYGIGRYARVYPVYLLSVLIMTPWIVSYVQLPDHAGLLASYGLVLQGWTALSVNWNTPAWSLSCELFFYACFPFAVVLLKLRSKRALAIVAACSLILPAVFRELGVPLLWKPVLHLADFLAGILVARVLDEADSIKGPWLYLPATAIIVALTARPDFAGSHIVFDAVIRIANAALILGLAIGGGLGVRALSGESMVVLGKASYSMYILHIPLLWWFKRFGLHQLPRVPVTAAAIVYVAAVVLVSTVVWRHFEEPANRMIRSWARA